MLVIALQGIRGGVSVTSIAAGLGWALVQLNESVLVIDFTTDNLLRLHFNIGECRAYRLIVQDINALANWCMSNDFGNIK
ncbi:cellulose synthase operon protein YhjQ/BcsQ [Legionella anisa]|uniref:cellulose synthase operon protein YhjQ/BcsQ n=1 Tax=Legionella anisa TaxID=28082 RepID=UPI00034758BE|nr:cellulose synthase operon protein YhjQ/BcsQ [Legionella anisa]KTC70376.1 cell division protein [Legionella anisa]MCW8426661.1 cellulose synthase operon protein YhjQ/BcsQ [Legionella anisa]MCW8448324.1 cellulose synthase operon protein YhjQ/BcsQ [Legionella anisa]